MPKAKAKVGALANWGQWVAARPPKFHQFANEPRPARWQVILYRNYWKAAHVSQLDDAEPGVPRDLEVTAANFLWKWGCILLMGSLMVFLSPKVLIRLGAKNFGQLSQLCQRGEDWDMAVSGMMRNLSGYNEAALMAQEGARIANWSGAILANGTYGTAGELMVRCQLALFDFSLNIVNSISGTFHEGVQRLRPVMQYPGKCTTEDAEAELAACEQEHCIKVLWVIDVKCAPTFVCPTEQSSALAAFNAHEQLNSNASSRFPKFQTPTVRLPAFSLQHCLSVTAVHTPKLVIYFLWYISLLDYCHRDILPIVR